MPKTVEADFDPGKSLTLKLWNFNTGILIHTFALTEVVLDPGCYQFTGVVTEGKYRSVLLIGADVVQRSTVAIGAADAVYHLGNWEGSIDIGSSYYLVGTGAFLITLTIEDGSGNPVAAAQVSLYAAGDQRHGVTNASGVVQFSSNATTWTVVITKPGFQFTPVQLVVIGNVVQTYDMTPLIPSLPALEDNQVHLQGYVFNEFGLLENGVKVKVQMIETPNFPGVYDNKIAEFTSVGGIVTITNTFIGAWYHIWRGKSKPMKYQVPEVAEDVIIVEIDPILGNDEDDPCL